MSKYEKIRAISEDLIALCKKHNVAIANIPNMIKKRSKNSKFIKENSLMNIFILDGSKSEINSKMEDENKKILLKKIRKENRSVGKDIEFPSSITFKLSKARGK